MYKRQKYRKLAGQKGNTGNSWGDWDPEKFTVEDSCFGFVVMEDVYKRQGLSALFLGALF